MQTLVFKDKKYRCDCVIVGQTTSNETSIVWVANLANGEVHNTTFSNLVLLGCMEVKVYG